MWETLPGQGDSMGEGPVVSTPGYVGRLLGLAVSHPGEFKDRLAARVERELLRRRGAPNLFSDPEGWLAGLHRVMGWPADCYECLGFDRVWAGVKTSLAGREPPAGEGHDAGIGLARAAYAAVRHAAPARVVETGVARGITSRVVLEAMHENGIGHLWSVDLPPLDDPWHRQTAIAVPAHLKGRWTYVRGPGWRALPGLLDEAIPLFIHDSSRTYRAMSAELAIVWPRLDPGGLILCGGVDRSEAFRDFGRATQADWIVSREERRSRYVGALRRA